MLFRVFQYLSECYFWGSFFKSSLINFALSNIFKAFQSLSKTPKNVYPWWLSHIKSRVVIEQCHFLCGNKCNAMWSFTWKMLNYFDRFKTVMNKEEAIDAKCLYFIYNQYHNTWHKREIPHKGRVLTLDLSLTTLGSEDPKVPKLYQQGVDYSLEVCQLNPNWNIRLS